MESFLADRDLWESTCRGDITPPEEASTWRQCIMRVARALFAIKVLVADHMLEYPMEVETPKEA